MLTIINRVSSSPSSDAGSFGLDSSSTSPNLSSLRKVEASSHETTSRCARQDSLRRRDMNLYYGLHPRLLHGSPGSPKLSLPPLSTTTTTTKTPQRNSPMRVVRTPLVDNKALEVPQGVIRSLSRDSTSSDEDLSGGERKNWIYEYMVDEKKKKIKGSSRSSSSKNRSTTTPGEEQQESQGHEDSFKGVENVDPDDEEENWK